VLRARNILEALADGPKLTRQLSAHCVCREVHSCIVRLRKRGYVTSREGVHEITSAGRDALEKDVKLGPGPCSDRASSRKGNTLRSRAWYVLRTGDFVSLDDMLSLLCTGEEQQAADNLRSWLTALTRAGYLTCRTACGVRRYRLRRDRDTGPEAPAWNRATYIVTDVNTDERYYVRTLKECLR
jgi:hypothetical protein